jgi:sporulation protein YlmC with PRC-barrel domain
VRVAVTKLLGLPAVDLFRARVLGEVTDVLIDPAASRLDALDVQPRWASPLRISAPRVRRIGRHAVMLDPGDGAPALPLEDEDPRIDLAALVGLEVLTDRGDRVGHLADAYVNVASLAIEAGYRGIRAGGALLGALARLQRSYPSE